jgi:transcription termination/antitermination protein NusG
MAGELQWYTLRVVNGQEKKVKEHLQKEVSIRKMDEFVGQIITPTEKVYQVRKTKDGKSKKITTERNTLPGYVIVQANLSNGEVLHTIRSVPGVLGFLNVDGAKPTEMPKPMRESEINRILGKIETTDEHEVQHDVAFSVGERVKVMDGPFNGFSGVVQEVFDDKKKLNVVVTIFGRNTPVELNYIQVEKES